MLLALGYTQSLQHFASHLGTPNIKKGPNIAQKIGQKNVTQMIFMLLNCLPDEPRVGAGLPQEVDGPAQIRQLRRGGLFKHYSQGWGGPAAVQYRQSTTVLGNLGPVTDWRSYFFDSSIVRTCTEDLYGVPGPLI